MNFGVITLFPEMLETLACGGITARALKQQQITLQSWNPRDFANNKHRQVDDRPYGGGPGMLMQVQPLRAAINQAKQVLPDCKTIYLSPQGRKLDQSGITELGQSSALLLVCGRYEGIDERLIKRDIDEEWSIGDYVLSGGELPAMILIDALTRQIPGALGHQDSAGQDSFYAGLLDYPHYTRPEQIDAQTVPAVLLGGNHEQIARWRLKQALGRTWLRRKDLLEKKCLDAKQQVLLQEFIDEYETEGQ
ncbi:tRNA (guanosine(37)-N1)-methyltransferase TrmD [Candidatus Venteria ishoeyi]|uniref:tRNA (guanine-N(1)-)-methyltransferase n=1 Tax=Candidatus Venteria ishoeyi TaxID=1899563 RepID=A0A1H6FD15_9GAMM|nr:tRNA (guanosine(37)-N1)-methyltransferase TrmD [Candidatus Venteria ishoeyi]MDM8546098.1 tRNA (guanosine(37)-N1)-methyltransferase TrmD [Candidatus Venteria ishoeyi]SEH07972.1 tRNA (guanine-N(1)-)-methyltransferase [Candidatus Venteria ishoeyi]